MPSLALHSIPEHDDEVETHQSPVAPVLFVNPFAPPTPDVEKTFADDVETSTKAPSPLAPNKSEGEEEEVKEEVVDGPENLTGHIKKISQAPVAMGGSSDVYYGEWQLSSPRKVSWVSFHSPLIEFISKVAIKILRTSQLSSVSAIQRVRECSLGKRFLMSKPSGCIVKCRFGGNYNIETWFLFGDFPLILVFWKR